ncbi:MAG: hypothetical protein SCALA702_09330 [Melioribacteraceae bacterium]|nr:MAG: hypothetical protein SCALA702_09330 [Melioribacteraceae bacterium]
MEIKKNIEKYSLPFLIIMYTVGVVGHSIQLTLPLMKTLTPFTLVLTGGVVFYLLLGDAGKKFFLWYIITYLFTLLVEIIGVKTGLVFGSYDYGNVLGLKVFDTPLIIGLNWVFVIAGAYSLSGKIFNSTGSKVLFTGLLAVAFDVILEPVAINLGYWNWEGGYIPIQNFVAWFVLAVIFGFTAEKMKLVITTKIALQYFLIQTIFFAILNFTL